MNKKEILDILDNAKDESGAVPMRLVRQAFDKLVQPEERTEKHTETHSCVCISRQAAIDAARKCSVKEVTPDYMLIDKAEIMTELIMLPPAQPEYEPVTAEDFAKTMSETSVYSYMLWHSEALTLMERQGFVICKKTM